MEIEELPDLKVNWIESYKYLAEPLLEYVWEVANHFLPMCPLHLPYSPTDMRKETCPLKKGTREHKK
mgnify:CR=1 FL=1